MSVLRYLSLTVLLLAAAAAAGASETLPGKTLNEVYPGFGKAALVHAMLADLPSGLILHCGEINVTQADIDSALSAFKPEMRKKVEKDPLYLLEDRAAQSLLYSEAYDWSVKNKVSKPDAEELIAAYVATLTKNVIVPEAEIKRFYDENKEEMGGMSLSEVKGDISKVMLDSKRLEAITAYVIALGNRYDIQIDKDWAAKQYPIAMDNVVEKARESGKPLFVDFGSTTCAPCRRLAPILDELKKEFAGRLNMLVLDVDDEPLLGARYSAVTIPMQIFYDKAGKEVFRHTGFYSKANIVAKLAEIGAK